MVSYDTTLTVASSVEDHILVYNPHRFAFSVERKTDRVCAKRNSTQATTTATTTTTTTTTIAARRRPCCCCCCCCRVDILYDRSCFVLLLLGKLQIVVLRTIAACSSLQSVLKNTYPCINSKYIMRIARKQTVGRGQRPEAQQLTVTYTKYALCRFDFAEVSEEISWGMAAKPPSNST